MSPPQVWTFNAGTGGQPLQEGQLKMFNSADAYVVLAAGGAEQQKLYLWAGADAPQHTLAAAAKHASSLNESLSATVVRQHQGSEAPEFLQLFPRLTLKVATEAPADGCEEEEDGEDDDELEAATPTANGAGKKKRRNRRRRSFQRNAQQQEAPAPAAAVRPYVAASPRAGMSLARQHSLTSPTSPRPPFSPLAASPRPTFSPTVASPRVFSPTAASPRGPFSPIAASPRALSASAPEFSPRSQQASPQPFSDERPPVPRRQGSGQKSSSPRPPTPKASQQPGTTKFASPTSSGAASKAASTSPTATASTSPAELEPTLPTDKAVEQAAAEVVLPTEKAVEQAAAEVVLPTEEDVEQAAAAAAEPEQAKATVEEAGVQSVALVKQQFGERLSGSLADPLAQKQHPKAASSGKASTYLADSAKAWGGVNGAADASPVATGAAIKPGEQTFGYEELKELRADSGIDMTCKEAYLTDEEFQKVFGKDRAAFKAMPGWRQQLAKKEVGLW